MKAIVCREYAPLDRLGFEEVADPVTAEGEVVVAVKAAGVNYPDALIVQGLYQDKPVLPFTPGIEFLGDILDVGEGCKGAALTPGQRVLGFSAAYGAYAEKVACPASGIIAMPDNMPYIDGANIACAYGTAHDALKQRANLKAGETLLVLGAAGGTGLAAVQIGGAMGAKVFAACSSAEKLVLAEENGADVLINYRESDLRAALKAATGGRGGGRGLRSCGGATPSMPLPAVWRATAVSWWWVSPAGGFPRCRSIWRW